MSQMFTNNGTATLAVALVARTADYTEDATLDPGSNLPWATYTTSDPRYMIATLTDGASHEVVKLYYSQPTTSATVRTIIRGQEGTEARAWPVGTSLILALTAGTVNRFFMRGPGHTQGDQALSLVSSESGGIGATGIGALAVGYSALASGEASTAIQGSATELAAVTVGGLADAEQATAIGTYSEAKAARSVAIGAISVFTPDSIGFAGLPVVTPSDWHNGTGYEFYQGAGEWVGTSEVLDFKTTQTVTPALPAGVRIFLTEVGVIVEDAASVTVQPTVSFGIVGTSGKHVAAVATSGLTAAWKRQRYTSLLSDEGETALEAKVTAGATATTLQARFYWKGFAVCEPTA